jgi:hypothetical protein
MLARLWKALGLTNVELHINSIADAADRKAHREKLVAYFERHASILDEDAKRRLHSNPLRILDSKNPAMQAMIEDAPMLIDELGEGAQKHFEALKRLLDLAGVAYRVNPRIVRGLDYYNRTVFEFISSDVGAQSTICGGGRYDTLFEQLGGKPTPGLRVRLRHRAAAPRDAGRRGEGRVRCRILHRALGRIGLRGRVRAGREAARQGQCGGAGQRRLVQVAAQEGGRKRGALHGDHRRGRDSLGQRDAQEHARRVAGRRESGKRWLIRERTEMSGSYDFEEQERIAELKGWWEDNRWYVVGAIAAAVLAFAGFRGWQYWTASQADDAAGDVCRPP